MTSISQPSLIVVHGPPGAGKSTLARALGGALSLPVLDRDAFKDAMFDHIGWSDRDWSIKVGMASWAIFWDVIERLLRGRSSLVADSNFRPTDVGVVAARRWLREVPCSVVEVYCHADDDMLFDRYDARRSEARRHPGHVGYDTRDEFVGALHERPHGPLNLGGLLIEVDTSSHWADVESIVERIR